MSLWQDYKNRSYIILSVDKLNNPPDSFYGSKSSWDNLSIARKLEYWDLENSYKV